MKFNNSITLRYFKSMGKAKKVSNEIKKLIVNALEKNMSYRKISELYDVSQPGISDIKRFCRCKTIENKLCTGRPRVTTKKADRLLVRYSKKDT